MSDDFERILDEAEKLTDEQMDSRISSLTRLTDSELGSLFPSRVEKEKLVQLMQIVRSAASDNDKRRQLIDNIESVAMTVIKLASKLA